MHTTQPLFARVGGAVLFSSLLVALATGCGPSHEEMDVLLRGARVVDGTGAPARDADVGIRDGRIAAVGALDGVPAKLTLDVDGRVVAPGFIDMMGGSSLPLLLDPISAESKLRQGITTMLAGEGGSLAPQNAATLEGLRGVPDGVSWSRFSEYFALLEEQGVALNVVHNVGATQVRRVVLGDTDVAPTDAQLETMRGLVRDAMEDGAVGLSTSLIYPPATYASTEELIALATVAAEANGVYFTHMRNESSQVLEAIEEALTIGSGADIAVHIYHLKAAGEENWPLMAEAIERLASARASGEEVTADVYPYIRNGIGLGSFLHPRHYRDGAASFLQTLGDDGVRRRLREEVETTSDWENWYRHVGSDWHNVLITRVGDERDAELVGLSIQEAAEARDQEAWDTFFDLVRTGGAGVSPKSMDEAQKHAAMRAPFIAFDNDASPTNPSAVASSHPRAFGAFPRVLAKYVRDEGVLPLEEAIRKLTSLPAEILRLEDRGTLEPGSVADVVVFDPETIRDTATFTDPLSYSVGIDFMLVGGVLVIENGETTESRPGEVIRHRPRASR